MKVKGSLILSGVSMVLGASVATFLLTNKNTKNKTEKVINTALDELDYKLQGM